MVVGVVAAVAVATLGELRRLPRILVVVDRNGFRLAASAWSPAAIRFCALWICVLFAPAAIATFSWVVARMRSTLVNVVIQPLIVAVVVCRDGSAIEQLQLDDRQVFELEDQHAPVHLELVARAPQRRVDRRRDRVLRQLQQHRLSTRLVDEASASPIWISAVCFCSRTDWTVTVIVAVVAAVLPARSVAVPETVVVPSLETTTSAGHAPAAIPDSASVHVKWIVTGPV